MNKTKYNQLREEIIKANGDILELKFGCKIKIEEVVWKVISICGDDGEWSQILLSNQKYTDVIGRTWLLTNEEFDILKFIEILGRDITPIDILKTRNDLAIDGLGGIFIRNHCNKKGDLWEMEYCGHYDIGKPLQDQSEPTINLLWDLIAKK